jgi:RecA/RadA recombinase
MNNVIPEPHAGYAERIRELVAADQASLRDQIAEMTGLSISYATRLVEDPSIICVAGERGSGKTTVLATAAAQLAADGHVVIPPIRPEYFVAPSSLITTTVAHLRTTVHTNWLDGGEAIDHDASIKMTAAIDRTLQQANLVLYDGAESQLLRADEQAADRSLAVTADSNFLDEWRTMTSQVRAMAAAQGKSHPLIVIPVDDPDLAPGTLRQILLDLRLMTSVDGVVGITCLDLDEARSVLTDAYMKSYRESPGRLLTTRVVDAQIAKALPDDRRVTIAGLDREHKLSFKALDLPLPSIQELCRSFEIGGDYGSDTLANVFRLPSNAPSPYANALPSNPRDLRALAYRLSIIPSDSPARVGEAAMELCRSAIATGLKQSGATDPTLWPSGLPFEVLDEMADGRLSCQLRFDDIAVLSASRIERVMPGSKDEDSTMRVVVGYASAVETRLKQLGSKKEAVQRLDPALSYAILLVREFSDYYGVIGGNTSGSVPIRGGEGSSGYFGIWLDGVATDNRFLNAPAWEAYYDYFVLDEAMRALVPVATEEHELSDRRLVIEGYFIDFCRAITAVQKDRRPPDDPAHVSRLIRERGEREAAEFLDQELVELFEEFEACIALDTTRDRSDGARPEDFKRWVEVGLVNMCHDRLLRPSFIDSFLEHRSGLLLRQHRLQAANTDAASFLEDRIKAKLDEAWVQQLIELVRRFDEGLGGLLLASHHAALQAVERSRHRLLGEAALTPPDTNPEPEAPGQEATSEYEIALDVLDQLEAEAQALSRRSNP